MCNRYGNRVSYQQYVDEFSQTRFPLVLPTAGGIPNLEPRDDIRPTDVAPILRRADQTTELVQLRWGFSPPRPKAPPVINFRSDGRSFTQGRCLIPASHFYEFTGTKYPKTKWKFTRPGEEWFCIAGLWRADDSLERGGAFTMLTMPPGPDVAPYHDRQIVVLQRSEWEAWLDPEQPSEGFFCQRPPGFLDVLECRA